MCQGLVEKESLQTLQLAGRRVRKVGATLRSLVGWSAVWGLRPFFAAHRCILVERVTPAWTAAPKFRWLTHLWEIFARAVVNHRFPYRPKKDRLPSNARKIQCLGGFCSVPSMWSRMSSWKKPILCDQSLRKWKVYHNVSILLDAASC